MTTQLKKDLIESGKIGRRFPKKIEEYSDLEAENGVSRQEGSKANQTMRAYAVERMRSEGLTISFDRFGNIFGRLEGRTPGEKSVMCGSHLDSVVNGGFFDGALGVFTAIEAVRRIKNQGIVNDRPIEIVAFTGEEGSAFSTGLLGSSAMVGKIGEAEALSAKNADGHTLEEVLLEAGYQGEENKKLHDVEYFLELHIEQGPVLSSEKIPIGIVENIVGIVWLNCTIKGVINHAGTTPMTMRNDALVAGAKVVSFINERVNALNASRHSSTVATVGRFTTFPNGINIVPGKVELGIDIRDESWPNILSLQNEINTHLRELEKRYGVDIDIQTLAEHKPSPLSTEVINAIESSTRKIGYKFRKINSGAGHDTQNMAGAVKSGMIFVPSVNGVSHSPMEWTHWDDVEIGAQVLTETVIRLCKKNHGLVADH